VNRSSEKASKCVTQVLNLHPNLYNCGTKKKRMPPPPAATGSPTGNTADLYTNITTSRLLYLAARTTLATLAASPSPDPPEVHGHAGRDENAHY